MDLRDRCRVGTRRGLRAARRWHHSVWSGRGPRHAERDHGEAKRAGTQNPAARASGPHVDIHSHKILSRVAGRSFTRASFSSNATLSHVRVVPGSLPVRTEAPVRIQREAAAPIEVGLHAGL